MKRYYVNGEKCDLERLNELCLEHVKGAIEDKLRDLENNLYYEDYRDLEYNADDIRQYAEDAYEFYNQNKDEQECADYLIDYACENVEIKDNYELVVEEFERQETLNKLERHKETIKYAIKLMQELHLFFGCGNGFDEKNEGLRIATNNLSENNLQELRDFLENLEVQSEN